MLSGDAGLARYRLTVVPWLWLATQRRASRVFEAKPVLDIVRHVLDGYEGYVYRVADDVEAALADLAPRPYTTQYRETDYDFIARLLAEAGLGWTVLEDAGVPARHVVQLFADSRGLAEDAESAGGGIRFQRAAATESRDTVQMLARQRRRVPDSITVLGWHDSGKRAVAAQALVNPASGQDDAAGLDWYEVAGHGGFADEAQARRQANLATEALRARAETFVGLGWCAPSVPARVLRCGICRRWGRPGKAASNRSSRSIASNTWASTTCRPRRGPRWPSAWEGWMRTWCWTATRWPRPAPNRMKPCRCAWTRRCWPRRARSATPTASRPCAATAPGGRRCQAPAARGWRARLRCTACIPPS
ncbi:contractile injection system protein, VgrG/Pvc8 family [Achromobacter xylosoxidans]